MINVAVVAEIKCFFLMSYFISTDALFIDLVATIISFRITKYPLIYQSLVHNIFSMYPGNELRVYQVSFKR